MPTIIIGDKVKLLPPFSSEKIYTVIAVEGAYLTLNTKSAHKDIVIFIKCVQKHN